MKTRRMLKYLAIGLVMGVSSLHAQKPSPYVPIDHWTMRYVEHLISAGVMVDPDPLTRPLTQRQLRNALLAVDTAQVDATTRQLVGDLIREFPERTASPSYYFDGFLGFRAKTYGRRRPLRQGGVGLGAFIGQYDASATFGNFLLNSTAFFDRQLRGDPEYTGVIPGSIANRVLGHIAFQFEHGEFFWGNISRNWGPAALSGFQISDVPYSYDHFALRLGTDHFSLEMLATPLDTVSDLQEDTPSNRYLMAHRLIVHAIPKLTVSFSETALLAGPGRNFDIWYLNPLRSAWLAADDENERDGGNFSLAVDVDFRASNRLALFSSLFMDDGPGVFDLRNLSKPDSEPSAFGFTAGFRTGLPGPTSLTAYYTMVSLLAYRSSSQRSSHVYSRRGIGIARNFSDYDQFTVKMSILPHRSTLLQPEITLLRQGEGDFRDPFPPRDQLPVLPHLHLGTVERTWRLAVNGTATLKSRVTLRWDAGLHLVRNLQNVAGASESRFVGSIAIRLLGDDRDFWWWLPTNW